MRKKKSAFFVMRILLKKKISMYRVLNQLSENIYFDISKNIPSYAFLLVPKIVKNLQCISKGQLKVLYAKAF